MAYAIEYTDEFGNWWISRSSTQQEDVAAVVALLEEQGTHLGYPFSSDIKGSRHSHLRELRVQSKGRPIRVFYAFDPRRMAILLIGGEKSNNKKFYKQTVAWADDLYDTHLNELTAEGLLPASKDPKGRRKK
jgi:hypothetical protein